MHDNDIYFTSLGSDSSKMSKRLAFHCAMTFFKASRSGAAEVDDCIIFVFVSVTKKKAKHYNAIVIYL